jgi:hypothetical protein
MDIMIYIPDCVLFIELVAYLSTLLTLAVLISVQRKTNESLFWFQKLSYVLYCSYSLFWRLMPCLKQWNCKNQQNTRAILLCTIV